MKKPSITLKVAALNKQSREKNDDHMTYHKNTVPFFSTFSSAHGTRNGEWRMERAKSRS